MQVFGDACAFVLQGALLFYPFEMPVKSSLLGKVNGGDYSGGCANNSGSNEPPCLPKMPPDHDVEIRLTFTPNAGTVTSGDMKSISTRRKITVKGAASRSRL